MMKWMLAAGAAALAITAPAAAQGGKGGGHQAHAQKAERSGGKAPTQRSGGGKLQAADSGRGQRSHAMTANTRGGDRSHGRQLQFAQANIAVAGIKMLTSKNLAAADTPRADVS